MGSANDAPLVEGATKTLEEMGIDYEVKVISAHRQPEKVRDYGLSAPERGFEVLIAAAGGAAGFSSPVPPPARGVQAGPLRPSKLILARSSAGVVGTSDVAGADDCAAAGTGLGVVAGAVFGVGVTGSTETPGFRLPSGMEPLGIVIAGCSSPRLAVSTALSFKPRSWFWRAVIPCLNCSGCILPWARCSVKTFIALSMLDRMSVAP